MASLGDKMVSALFGQTEAEKAFRPWWDNLEDILVYGLILLGKQTIRFARQCKMKDNLKGRLPALVLFLGFMLYPTSIVSNAPLDCTICKENNCKFEDQPHNFTPYNGTDSSGPYNGWWVKKYCTFHGETGVEEFILYFPYVILIIPLVMIVTEHCFIR